VPDGSLPPAWQAPLLAAAIALLQLKRLLSWLAWCPPWLAAVATAVLGACVLAVDRWRERRHADADREQQSIDRLYQYAGRQKVIFPRIGRE
jgi:membrane protein implicated in regulation of membrane protease activity